MKYSSISLLFVITMVICIIFSSDVYAEKQFNSDVPTPIMTIELGGDEQEAVNTIKQAVGEPNKDYLYYEYFDVGKNAGGSNWEHIYTWKYNSDAFISISARKGKVVSIIVDKVGCKTSTGVNIGDTVENFIKSFSEPPYSQTKISSKMGRLEYSTVDTFNTSKYDAVYKTTRVFYNPNTGAIYKMASFSSETFVGESPYTSREEQLGSSNNSRDGVKKELHAG